MEKCKRCGKRYRPVRGRHYRSGYCSLLCAMRGEEFPVKYIWLRDRMICHLCGKLVPLEQATRDHVVPKSLGGKNKLTNIKLAHYRCNHRRGNRPVESYQKEVGYEPKQRRRG